LVIGDIGYMRVFTKNFLQCIFLCFFEAKGVFFYNEVVMEEAKKLFESLKIPFDML
jgi:hypothetical protein